MIPDDVVDEVRERADIVGVIGEFVALQKAGKEFTATGNVMVNGFGQWMIEVQQFRVAEE